MEEKEIAEKVEETEKIEAAETEIKAADTNIISEKERLLHDKKMWNDFEKFKRGTYCNMIDSTFLKQVYTEQDIKTLCQDAEKYSFKTVCVFPTLINLCKRNLRTVKVATVVGFPFGEEALKVKLYQTKVAVRLGADEIDMVACISAIKQGDYRYVRNEVYRIVRAAKRRPVKVIIETSFLDQKQIEKVSAAVMAAGAAYVKTSTGMFGEGATVANIKLIKSVVGDKCKIKASGGIRTADDLITMAEAGADRIGTSAAAEIAKQLYEKFPIEN